LFMSDCYPKLINSTKKNYMQEQTLGTETTTAPMQNPGDIRCSQGKQNRIVVFCDPPVSKPGHNVGGCHAVVSHLVQQLSADGHNVTLVTSEIFAEPAAPVDAYAYVSNIMERGDFDRVHIVTATRVGLLARRYCVEHGLQFTATYDTQMPEYLQLRCSIPVSLTYSYLCWFYQAATRVIVPTASMKRLVESHGMERVVVNGHGVDTDLFQPLRRSSLSNPREQWLLDNLLPRPILLYVGRLTPEKSVQDFLKLRLGGMEHSKVLVGNVCGGLTLEGLQAYDPDAIFVGVKTGRDLADYYERADVLVFPSKTDTFGLVMLEALAAGCPVAAYPVVGSVDVITDPEVGCLNDNLDAAVLKALKLSRQDCRKFALKHTWQESIRRFASHFTPCRGEGPVGPHSHQVWNDMSWADLEKLVDHTAMVLWGEEQQKGDQSQGK
jgi:glycosyltransferase involved in cell wall biosynthesis